LMALSQKSIINKSIENVNGKGSCPDWNCNINNSAGQGGDPLIPNNINVRQLTANVSFPLVI